MLGVAAQTKSESANLDSFLKGAGQSSIRSREEVIDQQHPDPDRFLKELGLPPYEATLLRPLVHEFGPERAFYSIGLAKELGIVPENTNALAKRFSKTPVDMLADYLLEFSCSSWTYKSELPADLKTKVLRSDAIPTERVKLFPATFRVLPAMFGRPALARETPAWIFAMNLPNKELLEVRRQSKEINGEHVLDSFGYVRFHLCKDHFVVTEIQNDLYRKLESRGLRERYKHWSKQLMLAFEHYIGKRVQNPDIDELEAAGGMIYPRILIPGAAGMRRVWPDKRDPRSQFGFTGENLFGDTEYHRGIAGKLAERLYTDLPRSIGYEEYHSSKEFPEQTSEGKQVSIGSWWQKTLPLEKGADYGARRLAIAIDQKLKEIDPDQLAEAQADLRKQGFDDFSGFFENLMQHAKPDEFPVPPFYEEFGRLLRKLPEAYFDYGVDSLELFPCDLIQEAEQVGIPKHRRAFATLDYAGMDVGAEIEESFVVTPAQRIPLHQMPGITPQLEEHYVQMLQSPLVQQVRGLLPDEFTYMSRGIENGMRDDWWSTDRILQPLHIKNQDRHPVIRLTTDESDGQIRPLVSIGVKGGGLRDKTGAPIMEYNDVQSVRVPVYPLNGERHEAELIPSHKLWGGLMMQHGRPEFLNTLAVSHLMDTVGAEQWSVPIPLDLVTPVAMPIIDGKNTRLCSLYDYGYEILDNFDVEPEERLVTLRSLSRSDVRLSQIVNKIFKRSRESEANIELCEREIRQALSYLYWVHDETLEWPNTGIQFTSAEVGPRELLNFLAEVYERNESAADRILTRLQRSPLSVIAAVHGAGGHLGGAWHEGLGAVSGGAPTIRNIDAYGTVHDLDGDLFLPWVPTPEMHPRLEALQRGFLQHMQMRDAIYYRDTMYWSHCILQGARPERQVQQREHSLGQFDRIHRFGELDEELRVTPISTEHTGQNFQNALLRMIGSNEQQAFYQENFKRGREYVRDHWRAE